jgi:hypothetical protein
MNRHAQLETERVEEIIKQVGSSEPILLADEFNDLKFVESISCLDIPVHTILVVQGHHPVLVVAALL